jgi:peptidoglycan hydrolase-like protein with peptidoglycan-binding domain
MTVYSIQTNLIPNLPRIAYNGGVGASKGSLMHSTAVYNDSDTSERNYECSHYGDAFVHTFTDPIGIMKVADWDYIGYGAGSTANHAGYVHHELCQTHDHSLFLKSFDMWCWVGAKGIFDGRLTRSLGVVDGVTLMSHAQASAKFHETDHDDPIGYLKEHGKTWADVVATVTMHFNEMSGIVGAPEIVHPAPQPVSRPLPTPTGHPLLEAGSTNAFEVKRLQAMLNAGVTGVFSIAIKQAVLIFQSTNRLTADGVVGNQTWGALIARTKAHMPSLVQLNSPNRADVMKLQSLLGITADGDFGKNTLATVMNYQKAHGLVNDGVVGDKTWSVLLGM